MTADNSGSLDRRQALVGGAAMAGAFALPGGVGGDKSHRKADTDVEPTSIHHTLGTTGTQAAAGDHVHDDIYARAWIGDIKFSLIPDDSWLPAQEYLAGNWIEMKGQLLPFTGQNYPDFKSWVQSAHPGWYVGGVDDEIIIPDTRRRVIYGAYNEDPGLIGPYAGMDDPLAVGSRSDDLSHRHSITDHAGHSHNISGNTGDKTMDDVSNTATTGAGGRLTGSAGNITHSHGAGTLVNATAGAHDHSGNTGYTQIGFLVVTMWIRVRNGDFAQ